MENYTFAQGIGLVIFVIVILALLVIQYTMVVVDIKNNNAKNWEIAVGVIPLGPYILMLFTMIWHILFLIFKRRNSIKNIDEDEPV